MGEVVSMGNQGINLISSPQFHQQLELPSTHDAPILKDLGRLGVDRFMDRHAVETQTDARGFVDHGWLLSYIHSLVPRDHVWTGHLDVHHLQWVEEWYQPQHFQGEEDPSAPSRLRDSPFHKFLIPRDIHDLIHITTLPPALPEYKPMLRRATAIETAVSLFQTAKQAIDVESRERRLVPAPHPKYREKTFDPVSRRLIERDVLIDRYWEVYEQFKGQLSDISQQDVDDLINLELIKDRDPIFSVVSSLDRAVRLNKKKQAIRPKVRWQPSGTKRPA